MPRGDADQSDTGSSDRGRAIGPDESAVSHAPGDERLSALYDAHARPVWRYVVSLTGDRAGADDVVQETLLRAWRTPRIMEQDPSTARAWMITVARHLVIDEARSARRRHEQPMADPPERAAADETDRLFEAILVEEALRTLSPEHRAVILTAYYRGRSVAQTAAELDIPEGTVKSRLHYGLRAMRLALQGEGSDPMNPDHGRYADWDAAYVLGALSADDRRDYEKHLEACPECRRAVSELAPTVAMLSRVSSTEAETLLDEDVAEATDAAARTQIASLARARARRRRRTWWISAAAAAVIVVGAVAVPVTISTLNRPTEAFALSDVADVSLQANVRLTSVGWGTRIDLDCRYPAGDDSDAPAGGWTYVLAVVGTDGATSTVSTWRAGPGTSARLSAGTALDVTGIRSVEIRSTSGAVLMRYDLATAG